MRRQCLLSYEEANAEADKSCPSAAADTLYTQSFGLAMTARHLLAIASLGMGLTLSGCSPIEQSTITLQTNAETLTTRTGQPVLEVIQLKSLPNIFGKADLYGRRTVTGAVSVHYAGLRDGQAVFNLRTIAIVTGATTMNSTPGAGADHIPTGKFDAPDQPALALLPPALLPALPPQTQATDLGLTEIVVGLRSDSNNFSAAGKLVTLTQADAQQVSYTVSDAP